MTAAMAAVLMTSTPSRVQPPPHLPPTYLCSVSGGATVVVVIVVTVAAVHRPPSPTTLNQTLGEDLSCCVSQTCTSKSHSMKYLASQLLALFIPLGPVHLTAEGLFWTSPLLGVLVL